MSDDIQTDADAPQIVDGGFVQTPNSRWFIDPDGDLLFVRPVLNIWITEETRFLRPSTFKVHLELEGSGHTNWVYFRKTLKEAEDVRTQLIRDLCLAK